MDLKIWGLALKYTRAFFNYAEDELVEEQFWAMRAALKFLIKRPAVLNYFYWPNSPEAKQLRDLFCQQFGLTVSFSNLILLLQKHERVHLLPSILKLLQEEYVRRKGQLFFEIQSFPELSKSQLQQVVSYLEKETNCAILYEYSQSQQLIAGIRASSVQFLYADNLQQHLQKIQYKLIRQI